MASSGSGKKFSLIRGGLDTVTSLGGISVVAAPREERPFRVDAMVFEEDTWLVMSAEPRACQPEVHPIRLMTELIEAKPEVPGHVLIRPGSPMRFLAIVHDFNREPTWKEKWISQALMEVFRESEKRNMRAIGVPLLCTRHGKLDLDRFLLLILYAIDRSSFEYLKRLWLITHKRVDHGFLRNIEEKWILFQGQDGGQKE